MKGIADMQGTRLEKDVVVIGAGISGLATAYRLHKAGLDVLVLEKSASVGGALQTEKRDGFLIDLGPNSTLDTSPEISGFVDELGLAERRVNANSSANRRYILRDGRLCPLPMSPPAFLSSKLFSWRAKIRLFAEPFIRPAPQDKEETIAEFVERRLGREFLDYAINPFIAGVYAGDPQKLSVRSAVAKIYALEEKYGSLIKGAIKGARERKKRAETDKTKAQLFSFRDGMIELPATLQKALAERVLTECAVLQVSQSSEVSGTYEVAFSQDGVVRRVMTRSVIFTTPAFVTAELLQNFSASPADVLKEMTYPPVVMVFLGFKNELKCRPLDGFGFLVPEVEQRKILGCIWSSTIFPERAPAGGAALTTFVGGMRQPELAELPEDELAHLVQEELKDLIGLQTLPDVIKVKRWSRAIPQYELGHQSRIETLTEFEKKCPGLFIAGNFRGGISVGDCIIQSARTANRVQEFVGQSTARVREKRVSTE